MTTMSDDTLRRLLDAHCHGCPTDDRRRADLYDLAQSEGIDPETLYHAWRWGGADEADAELAALAPALAAEVLRLRAEIERRDADDAELHLSEIERHQRMCAALDIPEEARAYATDAEVEAAATDAVCERDALAAEVLRLRAERDDLHAAARVRVYVTDDVARIAEYASVDLLTLRAAARAHLAADDALSLARRTDAADVPAAEARALAARERLAGLVGIGGGR